MRILLNGEETDTRGAATIAQLITRFELSSETILIEHNGVALHRREWTETHLTDADRLEIIRVAAGG